MMPNFFILGAPKCGTTSLAHWLSKHPSIFISDPKEPRFFNTDFNLPGRPNHIESYQDIFAGAQGYEAIGEASTGYLVSEVAVKRIVERAPNSRFIVCLRHPADMVVSLHAQRLKEGVENIKSCQDAWNAQCKRREGKNSPVMCPDLKLLDYERFCMLGAQVDALLHVVNRKDVCFVLLEDLQDRPESELERVCRFLGVRPVTLGDFNRKNEGYLPRSIFLSQLARGLMRFRQALGLTSGFGVGARLREINRSYDRNKAPHKFKKMLHEHFRSDIELLAQRSGLDIAHWLDASRV